MLSGDFSAVRIVNLTITVAYQEHELCMNRKPVGCLQYNSRVRLHVLTALKRIYCKFAELIW
jgi:hypothetical protein